MFLCRFTERSLLLIRNCLLLDVYLNTVGLGWAIPQQSERVKWKATVFDKSIYGYSGCCRAASAGAKERHSESDRRTWIHNLAYFLLSGNHSIEIRRVFSFLCSFFFYLVVSNFTCTILMRAVASISSKSKDNMRMVDGSLLYSSLWNIIAITRTIFMRHFGK